MRATCLGRCGKETKPRASRSATDVQIVARLLRQRRLGVLGVGRRCCSNAMTEPPRFLRLACAGQGKECPSRTAAISTPHSASSVMGAIRLRTSHPRCRVSVFLSPLSHVARHLPHYRQRSGASSNEAVVPPPSPEFAAWILGGG